MWYLFYTVAIYIFVSISQNLKKFCKKIESYNLIIIKEWFQHINQMNLQTAKQNLEYWVKIETWEDLKSNGNIKSKTRD